MKRIHVVPNLFTLANAFCGLLALAKAVDALAFSPRDPAVFYGKMETACFLIFLGMVFDGLDGAIARLTKAYSDFGAQLDSFADAITFGLAPALLAKVLIEHEAALCGYDGNPRLHFVAAAAFTLMAILRLVRFNLETEHDGESHRSFRGLPSPAAAGAVASTTWLYLLLRRPELEVVEQTPTPLRRILKWMEDVDWGPWLDWMPVILVASLPLLGILMVSRVRYVHPVQFLLRGNVSFFTLVGIVFAVLLFLLAPVPFLFLLFNGFALLGLAWPIAVRWRARRRALSRAGSTPG